MFHDLLQIDSVDRPSWQAQLSGKKTWTLIPPPECEHVCQSMTITINKGEICKSASVLIQIIGLFSALERKRSLYCE